MKKIELVYRDLYESCGQVLKEELATNFEYSVLNFSDVLKYNIENKTTFGIQMLSFIENGELVPDELTFKIIKQKIDNLQSDKLLLINYPRNEVQTKLFIEYCMVKNYKLIRAWHFVALNVLENLENYPNYSKVAIKYDSYETIKYRSERSHRENNDMIKRMVKHCEIINFQSESYGNNFKVDKQRLKETIYNTV